MQPFGCGANKWTIKCLTLSYRNVTISCYSNNYLVWVQYCCSVGGRVRPPVAGALFLVQPSLPAFLTSAVHKSMTNVCSQECLQLWPVKRITLLWINLVTSLINVSCNIKSKLALDTIDMYNNNYSFTVITSGYKYYAVCTVIVTYWRSIYFKYINIIITYLIPYSILPLLFHPKI